jgi:hypothetical protein
VDIAVKTLVKDLIENNNVILTRFSLDLILFLSISS